MKIPENFEIDFVSDARFEDLLVEVSYKKQRFFLLNKEKGPELIEIEFIDDLRIFSEPVTMLMKLVELETVIALAKEALIKGA